MRIPFPLPALLALLSLGAARLAAEEGNFAGSFDVTQRVPWTTSRVVGTPEPPLPFRLQRVFARLPLKQPLFITHIPQTDQLLVIEQAGRIVRFTDHGDPEQSDDFLEVGEDTYSMAFDPRFAENRYVYIFSNGPREGTKKRNRIARYEVSRGAPYSCDPASRRVILEYESNGHNGGDLAFGPDGFLYISAGDGTSDSDTDLTGQNLADLPSAILRIDVHPADAQLAYAIPSDNPFLDLPDARGEIWSYGLRNPWRISFDRETGRLWVADVGQDWREYLHVIVRGGNCGWSVEEGGLPFQPLRARGPTPIVPPAVVHPHSEARSITGGHVYYGTRFPELRGAYIYGDFATGRVWGVRYDGQQVTWQRELADTALQIVSFGTSAAGELLVVDYVGGIYELHASEPAPTASPFPQRLSETGLFADVKKHEPAVGVVPYSVNAPLWSDGAQKERLIALPDDTQIQFTEARGWNFPDRAVVVKTFSFETPDDPPRVRRVETRLLVRDQGEWTGYSYAWNDEQTDAVLVPAAGRDVVLRVRDSASHQPREQTWHIPSRAECMMCHTRAANYVLGLSTPQMNRAHQYNGVERNQLELLAQLGYFHDPLPRPAAELPALADPRDATQSLDRRARSYLHANCAHCHVSAGGGNARLELEFTTPLEKTNLVGEMPLHDRYGIENARLLAPGQPERSILVTRLARTELGRMPPLATRLVDADAIVLLREWIAGLPVADEKK